MYTTEIRENVGVSSTYTPWTTDMGAQMAGVPRNTPRATELIECIWIKKIKDAAMKKRGETDPAKLAKGLYVVLSQSTHRNTGSQNIHALLQNSVLYSHPSVVISLKAFGPRACGCLVAVCWFVILCARRGRREEPN